MPYDLKSKFSFDNQNCRKIFFSFQDKHHSCYMAHLMCDAVILELSPLTNVS